MACVLLRFTIETGYSCGHTAFRSLSSRAHAPGHPRDLGSIYENTISHLKIGAHTRVIFQGFTGKQATFDAKQSLEYGTKIVGGVKPGQTGEHLGLPVLPSMRAAMEQLKPDATAVYVAAGQAAQAIEEAIEAEIALVVAVAEHIPLHDMLRIHWILRTQAKTRLVGPNAPGMISPIGKCRIGFPPIPFFAAGSVGIVAKSGTLSYETVASTTRAGIGQSLVIGVGGDVLPGTNLVDALNVFEHDEATKGIIIVGEVGGFAEADAAEWVKQYRKRNMNPKPIMGLVTGILAVPGRIMGHAGAFAVQGEEKAAEKMRLLDDAGVVMTDHPAKFGTIMKELLETWSLSGAKKNNLDAPNPLINETIDINVWPDQPQGVHQIQRTHSQTRSLHTSARRPRYTIDQPVRRERRNISFKGSSALAVLSNSGVSVTPDLNSTEDQLIALIEVDRASHQLHLHMIRGSQNDDKRECKGSLYFKVSDSSQSMVNGIRRLFEDLQLRPDFQDNFHTTIDSLIRFFIDKEASSFSLKIILDDLQRFTVQSAILSFDDAAYRSAGRHPDLQALRTVEDEIPEEVEAEKDGIVYIKHVFHPSPSPTSPILPPQEPPLTRTHHRLPGSGTIGTLVNGAGLAMNTIDCLTQRGGQCANFLDTGGKATRETVKASFRAILTDTRVNSIFVNIFGGLTRCDMIAEGIVLAYRDLGIEEVPVVVRLRGTNEREGQRMIAESGLPLQAFDDFEEAAKKVIELAGKP
ncbi:hypothetical protein MMC15_007091 [Xylographa vitiligo]|nr:hypothetical protein [Xylographa vitiligo]